MRDPAGQPLAEVPLIRSRKTLLSIAAGSSDVGVFDVEEPRLKIVLRADGSNAEDLLAKLPKSQNSKPRVSRQASALVSQSPKASSIWTTKSRDASGKSTA